jgi:transcription elongation factor Elf1
MKKPKKATIEVQVHTVEVKSCAVICPHCGSELRGDWNPNILMIACLVCGNPIDFRSKDGNPTYTE